MVRSYIYLHPQVKKLIKIRQSYKLECDDCVEVLKTIVIVIRPVCAKALKISGSTRPVCIGLVGRASIF